MTKDTSKTSTAPRNGAQGTISSPREDVYSRVTARIVADLEQGAYSGAKAPGVPIQTRH